MKGSVHKQWREVVEKPSMEKIRETIKHMRGVI